MEDRFANDLVELLNNDTKLIESLDSKKKSLTREEFISHNEIWGKKNHAKIHAILLNDKAIGMISLSHIKTADKSAKIGYWIASEQWGKGYATEAFRQMLEIAKENHIKSVSGTIPNGNKASKAIWQKFGAKFKTKDDTSIPKITIQ